MNGSARSERSERSPSYRAHRALGVLTAASVLLTGAVSGLVSAPPSPLVGLGFGISAVLLAVSLTLAARVTIALERVRRASRPAPASVDEVAPRFTSLFRRVRLWAHGRVDRG